MAPREFTRGVLGQIRDASSSELVHASLNELARRIRHRDVSSREVVEAFLSRIEDVNDDLNAVVQLRAEEALRDAWARDQDLAKGDFRGPLHGIPFTVKDSFDTAGLISTAGTPGRSEFVPRKDATVVERLRNAGAILLGKTNTPEITLNYETTNRVYGATSNPYDLSRTPGGSSGGAASILAASGSPLDIGSDTAGSIRVPAHFCGITGIKPTSGRVPRTGHVISFSGPLEALTHVGPMARYVGDLRTVLTVISGGDGVDPHVVPVPLRTSIVPDSKTLRVAYFTSNGIHAPTPETKATVESAVKVLRPHVAKVEEDFPTTLGEAFRLFTQIFGADGFDWVRRTLERSGTEQSSLLRSVPDAKPVSEFVRLVEEWDAVRSRALDFWRGYDLLVCPVSAHPATQKGTAMSMTAFSYSIAMNVTGWPAAVVRCGTSPEGLPIGVQVVAPMWREDVALAVAELLEQELGGWKPLADLPS
jgi:amidase